MSAYYDRWADRPKLVTLAGRIWELKREHGTLARAAAFIGVSAGELCMIRSGKIVTPSDKIITALGLKKPSYYERDEKGSK